MSYFSKFPKLIYDIKGNGEVSLFTHILKRVKLNAVATTNTQLFDYYQVSQGEKPEDIAFKYYGDATLHWVILLVNDIVDRFHQKRLVHSVCRVNLAFFEAQVIR